MSQPTSQEAPLAPLHLVLRTTHRTCRCGAAYSGVDLFEQRPGLDTLNQPVIHLLPYRAGHLPEVYSLVETAEVYPLAICPACSASEHIEPRPATIDVANWRQTQLKKAERPRSALRKSLEELSPADMTLWQLNHDLGG